MPILYKAITAVLALIGCLSLLLSGEVNLLMCTGGIALFPGYYRFFRNYPQASKRTAALLSQAVLAVFLADVFLITGDVFLAVAHLTITFQGIKSFDLKEPWDNLQVYFMALLQLIIASELTRSLSFGVLFMGFMVLLVTAMVLSHFLKQNALGKVRLTRPVSVIVCLTLAGTILFFVALPRTPQRFIGRNHFRGIRTIGFSDRVDFGSFGDVKRDPTVVMRIEMNRRVPPPYYWRGMTLDRFDGVSWQNTAPEKQRITKRSNEFLLSLYDPATAVVQDVFLEPIDSNTIFGFSKVAAVRTDTPVLFLDEAQDLSMPDRSARRVRYTVVSSVDAPVSGQAEPKYLQLPSGSDRIRELARRVTAVESSDGSRAAAIERYLSSNYAYTLSSSPPQAGMSVMDDFLFVSRKGYCEHYATAMVLLLRSIGIPARIVNGFYGGERNEYGNYLIIRQSDAHSWVEALVNGQWRRFDPTPAVTQQPPPSFSLLLDSLRMKWTRYVIGFSFFDQRELLRSLILPLSLARVPRVDLRNVREIAVPAILLPVILFLLITLLRRSVRNRASRVTEAYSDLRKWLLHRGVHLTPATTPEEISAMHIPGIRADALREFLRLYELYRFGGRTPDMRQIAALRAQLRNVLRTKAAR